MGINVGSTFAIAATAAAHSTRVQRSSSGVVRSVSAHAGPSFEAAGRGDAGEQRDALINGSCAAHVEPSLACGVHDLVREHQAGRMTPG